MDHSIGAAVDIPLADPSKRHGAGFERVEVKEEARGEVSFEDFEDVDTADLDGDDDFDDLDTWTC